MSDTETIRSKVVATLPVGNVGILKVPIATIGDVNVIPGMSKEFKELSSRMLDEGTISHSRARSDQVSGLNLVFQETRDLPVDDHMAFDHSRYAASRVFQAARALSLTGLYQHIVPASTDGGLTRHISWCTYCHCMSRMDVAFPCYKPGYFPINVTDVPEENTAEYNIGIATQLMFDRTQEVDMRLKVSLQLYDQMMACDIFGVGWVTRVFLGVTALETLYVRRQEKAYLWNSLPWSRLQEICSEYPNSFDAARNVLRKVRSDVVHRGGVSPDGQFGSKLSSQTVCLTQTLLRISLREICENPSLLP